MCLFSAFIILKRSDLVTILIWWNGFTGAECDYLMVSVCVSESLQWGRGAGDQSWPCAVHFSSGHWPQHCPHTQSFLGNILTYCFSFCIGGRGPAQGGKTLVSFVAQQHDHWLWRREQGEGWDERRWGWFTKNERRKLIWAIRMETFSTSAEQGWVIRRIIFSRIQSWEKFMSYKLYLSMYPLSFKIYHKYLA